MRVAVPVYLCKNYPIYLIVFHWELCSEVIDLAGETAADKIAVH